MAIALLLAACGKNDQPASKAAPKAGTTIPDILNLKPTEIEPDDVFSVSRKGEKVTIRMDVGFSACKGISILRNDVGLALNRQTVAHLPASTLEYVDTVPDARAYWYWIEVNIDGSKTNRVGPVRVKADTGKTGSYTDASAGMELVAQRTKSSVVIAWDLPKGKYKDVVIRRRHKPDFMRDQRTIVHTTTERSGDFTDQLPDQNADYWYWIDATKEDGSVISKGPVKAAFTINNK